MRILVDKQFVFFSLNLDGYSSEQKRNLVATIAKNLFSRNNNLAARNLRGQRGCYVGYKILGPSSCFVSQILQKHIWISTLLMAFTHA